MVTQYDYLIIPIAAWLVAQLLKYVFQAAEHRKHGYKLLYKSGGMPSSHSALMVSLLTTLGWHAGTDSALFGVTAVITAIIIYDAVNVRRAVGEQGAALRRMLKEVNQPATFYTARGHTLLEVIAGAGVGFCVAILLLQFL